MRNIDFLPAAYRQTHAVKRWQPWRIIVMLVVGTLLFAAVGQQYQRRHRLQAELARLLPAHEAAQRRAVRLAGLQAELQRVRADAQLCAYLRHPWPRTRILEALLAPLPEEVTFEHLQIQNEARSTSKNFRPATATGSLPDKDAEKALAALPAASRDLQQLRETCDAQQTTVALSGLTTDADALYRYLGQLAQSPLFLKADVVSIERDSGDRSGGEVLRFRAALVVKPCYAQPGGPTPAAAQATVKTGSVPATRPSIPSPQSPS